jgi:hypothetical protein
MNNKKLKKLAEFAHVLIEEREDGLFKAGGHDDRWAPHIRNSQAWHLVDELSFLGWGIRVVGDITAESTSWGCTFSKNNEEIRRGGQELADTLTQGVWKALKKEAKMEIE